MQSLSERFIKDFSDQFPDVEKMADRENTAAADTTGDMFLQALNQDTSISFSTGNGACQTRSFVGKENCHG